MALKISLVLAAVLLVAQPSAAEAPADAVPAPTPVEVAPVTVTASKATPVSGVDVEGLRCTRPRPAGERPSTPHVADSYPAQHGVVPSGLVLMRVTFSERMSPCSFIVQSGEPDYAGPPLDGLPTLVTPDHKTFYFGAVLKPETRYGMWFGTPRYPEFFRSSFGESAKPYLLVFKTSNAPPSKTDEEALAGDPASKLPSTTPGDLVAIGVPHPRPNPVCQACDAPYKIRVAANGVRRLVRERRPAPADDKPPPDDAKPPPH